MPQGNKTIVKAASLLGHLADGTHTVTDLSNVLGLSKATTCRLLKSLEISRLAIQDPVTHQYFLGPMVSELASKTLSAHHVLTLCAVAEMTRLRDLSGESVALYIRLGRERICVEEVESREQIKFTAGRGVVFPLNIGSSGKVLLSEMEEGDLRLLVESLPCVQVGPRTILDRGVFLREVAKARARSYATSLGERVSGGASICVPIPGYVCPVAMSVLGPDNRLSRAVMRRLLPHMRRAAARIAKRLEVVRRRAGLGEASRRVAHADGRRNRSDTPRGKTAIAGTLTETTQPAKGRRS